MKRLPKNQGIINAVSKRISRDFERKTIPMMKKEILKGKSHRNLMKDIQSYEEFLKEIPNLR